MQANRLKSSKRRTPEDSKPHGANQCIHVRAPNIKKKKRREFEEQCCPARRVALGSSGAAAVVARLVSLPGCRCNEGGHCCGGGWGVRSGGLLLRCPPLAPVPLLPLAGQQEVVGRGVQLQGPPLSLPLVWGRRQLRGVGHRRACEALESCREWVDAQWDPARNCAPF